MKKNNKKGFTLVELVIVIAVIAILAAVLIPTFTTVIANANKSAALQEATNLKTEILQIYAGDFDEYCKDYSAANKDKPSLTETDTIVGGIELTDLPSVNGGVAPTSKFSDYLDVTKISDFTVTAPTETEGGKITYTVGNYTVTITAKDVTVDKKTSS